jgi:hypothetical protein
MAIDPSADTIYCQNCGAAWRGNVDTTMYYFETEPETIDQTTAVALITAGVTINHCPKCPIPAIDRALEHGDNRSGS